MKEIGGYIELEGLKNNPFHKNALPLNSATNAVIYLIRTENIKKIYLPYYLCGCLNKIKEFCKVEYYKIDKNFTPSFKKKLKQNEYIYIVNYYGLLTNRQIKQYKKKFHRIIIDNVQAFFQKPVNNTPTIYSCRKFFGVPDGAYLYGYSKFNTTLSQDKSNTRFKHLLGRAEEDANKYYAQFIANEDSIQKLPLKKMSHLTSILMGAQDYKKACKTRTKNFAYLNSVLSQKNQLKIKNIRGAYMYPFYCKNSNAVRKELLLNKIYTPRLWQEAESQIGDPIGQDYAINIIPIPCDQRYEIADMKIITNIINRMAKI